MKRKADKRTATYNRKGNHRKKEKEKETHGREQHINNDKERQERKKEIREKEMKTQKENKILLLANVLSVPLLNQVYRLPPLPPTSPRIDDLTIR